MNVRAPGSIGASAFPSRVLKQALPIAASLAAATIVLFALFLVANLPPYWLVSLGLYALFYFLNITPLNTVLTALVRLSPVTHAAAVTLAELPDEIRGYEHVKLEGVARFRDKAKQLIAQLN